MTTTMETRCTYCAAPFMSRTRVEQSWRTGRRVEATLPAKLTCSPECAKRQSVWTGWIRSTSVALTTGDVNYPTKCAALPPAGASLKASGQRFRVQALGLTG